MPTLNVSSVLKDPRFKDKMLRRRNVQIIENGRAQNIPRDDIIEGVVTNNNGDELERLPDGSRVSGAINVHTQCDLISGADGRDADEICYQNRWYTVINVVSYSQYGDGFKRCICTLKPFSG